MSTRAYGSSPSLSPRCSDTSYSPDSTDDGRSARNRAKIFPSLLAKSCSSVLEEFTTQNSSRFPLAKSSSNSAPDTPKIYGVTQQSWEGGGEEKKERERRHLWKEQGGKTFSKGKCSYNTLGKSIPPAIRSQRIIIINDTANSRKLLSFCAYPAALTPIKTRGSKVLLKILVLPLCLNKILKVWTTQHRPLTLFLFSWPW